MPHSHAPSPIRAPMSGNNPNGGSCLPGCGWCCSSWRSWVSGTLARRQSSARPSATKPRIHRNCRPPLQYEGSLSLLVRWSASSSGPCSRSRPKVGGFIAALSSSDKLATSVGLRLCHLQPGSCSGCGSSRSLRPFWRSGRTFDGRDTTSRWPSFVTMLKCLICFTD